ncbi:MAG: endonuclease III domain-containing protein [Candidatus Aureabacteria bacterium]|nr:endonuclease III domain-containing protein [Candidatus Auribacterota bacterium]
MHRTLLDAFGPQGWWPAETPCEVIVGAILTQNTAWANVERAIVNLKQARLLSIAGLRRIPRHALARFIKPSGYFNQKAIKLKAFIAFLDREYHGSLKMMAREGTPALRQKLLGVHGIGPETADSILLDAFGRPVFVVDAYTVRIVTRHGFMRGGAKYHEVQEFFMERLPRRAKLYNEYHALIVRLGKEWCRPKPRCGACPLNGDILPNILRCRQAHPEYTVK